MTFPNNLWILVKVYQQVSLKIVIQWLAVPRAPKYHHLIVNSEPYLTLRNWDLASSRMDLTPKMLLKRVKKNHY